MAGSHPLHGVVMRSIASSIRAGARLERKLNIRAFPVRVPALWLRPNPTPVLRRQINTPPRQPPSEKVWNRFARIPKVDPTAIRTAGHHDDFLSRFNAGQNTRGQCVLQHFPVPGDPGFDFTALYANQLVCRPVKPQRHKHHLRTGIVKHLSGFGFYDSDVDWRPPGPSAKDHQPASARHSQTYDGSLTRAHNDRGHSRRASDARNQDETHTRRRVKRGSYAFGFESRALLEVQGSVRYLVEVGIYRPRLTA